MKMLFGLQYKFSWSAAVSCDILLLRMKQRHAMAAAQSLDCEGENDSASLPLDLLTLTDRKPSLNDSEFSCLRDFQSAVSVGVGAKQNQRGQNKNKRIHKKERNDQQRRKYVSRKKQISQLEARIEELQREVASLRRNEFYSHKCNMPHSMVDHLRYQSPIDQSRYSPLDPERQGSPLAVQTIHWEQPTPNQAGDVDGSRHSRDSLEFEKIDFHSPLMQTQEMQEKLWIFVGTMLIAMGSKVTDFDGTINVFKVLKQSVDSIRRQVDKSQSKLRMSFFCSKEEIHQTKLIDGMGFDPFFSGKEESGGSFSLEGVRVQSVQEYQLFYDYKYHFGIKYDALLTIMEYARQHCSIE